jgi:RNA polymerase sigma factor (sigma-70 family)
MLAKSQLNRFQYPPSGESTADTVSDRSLWQRIKAGSELSFSILYKRYSPILYNYAMHSCHDRDIALDCLQELFAAIWSKRQGLSDVYAINTYLFKSFRRLMVKKLMWRKRFFISLETTQESSFGFILPVESAIEQNEIDAERHARLQKALNALTKRQREALFLRFYNGLPYADIAAIMDIHVDSAYNLISKSIDILRSRIGAK